MAIAMGGHVRVGLEDNLYLDAARTPATNAQLITRLVTLARSEGRDIATPDVDVSDTTAPGGPSGEVPVRILRPRDAAGPLPVIVYIHGAGWVFGNAHTHDRRVASTTRSGASDVSWAWWQPRYAPVTAHQPAAQRWRVSCRR